MLRKVPRKLREERGQAAIFMALFASTMILLFAFTTNIGMLVHAKINLQNAADAAAYAGAATQARQLTSVAYLNYEMRRALKEFLFYYTTRGQYVAMPCFPLNHQGQKIPQCAATTNTAADARYDFAFDDPREFNNNEPPPAPGFSYLPSVCIIFDKDNNYCQKNKVAGIPEFPSGGGWGVADPIVAAVRRATSQIINKKLEDCYSRTLINQKFLIAWLFGLDPIKAADPFFSVGNDSDDPFPFSDGIERLGVLPRMALLRARIDNFEEALNMSLSSEGLSATITEETMSSLKGLAPAGSNKTLDYFERPIQAFLSARNNLPSVSGDNGNFSEIELTELLPTTPGNTEQNPNLKNPPILAKFDDLTGRAAFANSFFKSLDNGDNGNCSQYREVRVISRFPFGVTKNPNVLTYYAVRLQAKARLLFSPFGGNGIVTLSAYSAAKPFGSRVGKDLNPEKTDDGMLKMMLGKAQVGRSFLNESRDDQITGFSYAFPNVLVADGDTTSNQRGFSTNAHLGYLRNAVVSLRRLDYGPRLAGAYAPWEIGYYNPPANFQQDVIGKFEDNPVYGGKFFSLVAPVYPVNGTNGNDLRFIRDKVNQYLVADAKDRESLESGRFAEFLSIIQSDAKFGLLQGYLRNSKETIFHYIPDPMLTDEPQLQAYARSYGRRFTVAGMEDPYKRQLTSWNNQKTAADTNNPNMGIESNSELGLDMGRSGYSVRFVSFSSLKSGGKGTNDPQLAGVQWTNPLERFNGGNGAARISDDINKLKH